MGLVLSSCIPAAQASVRYGSGVRDPLPDPALLPPPPAVTIPIRDPIFPLPEAAATAPVAAVPAEAQPATAGRTVGVGQASWYGPGFHGRRTASGERFDQNSFTAAHRTLPFGSHVQVINQRTGQWIVVRINDRGPHVRGRIIDLSRASARAIGIGGAAPVRLVNLAE